MGSTSKGPLFLALLITLLSALFANAQEPESKITYFPNLPASLFFFEDTSTVVYHDVAKGDVHVSQDEGKTWQRADIPSGQASIVISHPFDTKYAFILTRGKTHYRTADRGKSWQSFEMPAAPAYVAKPLSFHSDPRKYGYILYQGASCQRHGWGEKCHDETYYTKDAFSNSESLLSETSRCQFAHSTKEFQHEAHEDLIYCVAYDTESSTNAHSLSSSKLFSSTDFFDRDNRVEDLGIGKNARGVVAFAILSKFAVVALKDLIPGGEGEMLLFVTVDTKTWAKAQFPHASSARLRENAYTIVESTTHSLAVDVVLQDMSTIGTLFVSNSNGTYFVQSLKDTNRNDMGYVDYENIYGIEGVGLANIVSNAQEVESQPTSKQPTPKQLKTRITFDDGRSWQSVKAPSQDAEGKRVHCNPADMDVCSLHLHSVTIPHNFGRIFSSPAPGVAMGVGSIGESLKSYDESDTFLSTDAGLTWSMIRLDAHKYEFGDSGSILVVINDEESTDSVSYSTDFGKTWKSYNFGVKLRARILTTVSDSTSQKFILIGQLDKREQTSGGRFAAVYLDFANTRSRQCGDGDFEDWYARTAKGRECLMGHKQWYKRRKQDANCYVGHKFEDPQEHEQNCPCEDDDYECDYNYIRSGDECVPAGPEPVPVNVCAGHDPEETYLGSSGYQLIPGNTCNKEQGVKKDEQVRKSCSKAQPSEGEITHQTFEFPSIVVQFAYFEQSTTILVRLADYSLWQSSNEGYSWVQHYPQETFLAFYHHKYTSDRAYAITSGKRFLYTTNTGRSWHSAEAPTLPNTFGQAVLHFHPESDYLIWTGEDGCSGRGENCHAEAHYSRDNGRTWALLDKYIRNCAWARDATLFTDPTEIICESYRDKTGNQKLFQMGNPLELIEGTDYYSGKKKLFDHVVGFAKFSEYLIVAEYQQRKQALDIQISLDGMNFAAGLFPPTMQPYQHAYTILDSSTSSIFLHVTLSEPPNPYWGNILKSNSNGTYFGLSMDYVNRDDRGYVDFEKMIGLDGIAIINVVSNPSDLSGKKELQTRISHNDGGTWKPIVPPKVDSQGRNYECDTTKCALHLHGYTERFDSRATFSTPSVPGLIMAVGNVGEQLARYTDSDTFMSRDAGFTWEEVHKDAHLYEFGDSGSVLVMANDEEPTDHVLFSTDEGLNWREYKFTTQPVRVRSIATVPSDTSRRFILFGYYGRSSSWLAIHIDISSLTHTKCVLDLDDPGKDDFELWSPSEEREERCLFGRQTLYHRRVRDRNCYVGDQQRAVSTVVKNCVCMESDFECEFNHERDAAGECVLVSGLEPLPNDDSCKGDDDYWYERTAYRKIPHSSCEGGIRLDRGSPHICPGFKAHSAFFWTMVFLLPFGFTALVGYWYYRRSGMARGTIRLPGDGSYAFGQGSGALATLASVPWFLIGVIGVAWEHALSIFNSATAGYRSRRGYRNVPVDEDAQILHFEDEE